MAVDDPSPQCPWSHCSDQVDAAGDGLDAVDGIHQRFTCRPCVTGIQAEANPLVANDIPEQRDDVEVAGHRADRPPSTKLDGSVGSSQAEQPATSSTMPRSEASRRNIVNDKHLAN